MKDHPPARQQRKWQRRGWRSLVWTVVVILLVQFVGGLLLDYCWPQVRFPAAARVLARCTPPPPGPLVITLGSSRFDGGIMADQVARQLREGTGEDTLQVVNLAVGCGDLIVAEHLYGKLRAQGVKPTYLVLEVSPETLNSSNVWLDQHAYRQLTWLDTLAYSPDLIRSGHYLRFWRSRLLPLYIHREQIVRHLALQTVAGTKVTTAMQQAFLVPPVKDEGLWPDPRMRHDASLRTQAGLDNIRRWLKRYQVGGAAAASLERLVQRCEGEAIPVLLVGVPVTSAHRGLYRPEIEAAFQRHMQDVTRRYTHTRYVDFRAAIPDIGFTDNHHLTPEGGMQFSRLLAEQALLPELREHHTISAPTKEKARE